MDKAGVPMKGLVQAGPKGPWCHRVERLVHIELSDLVEHTPYLEDGYPNVSANKEVGRKVGKKDVKRCPDCMCPSLTGGNGGSRGKLEKVTRNTRRSSRLSEWWKGGTKGKSGKI